MASPSRKSIFRRPTDSNSSEASENAESPKAPRDLGSPSSIPHTASDILQPEIAATGAGPQVFNPLTLYSPLHPAIPSLPQSHHTTFLISSLLENYVRTRVPNNPVLAENLYTEIAQRLPDLGIAPQNSQHFSRAELSSVRQGYLDGLDGLLQQALEKNNDQNRRKHAPGDLSRGGQMSIVRRDNSKPTLRRMMTELPGGGRSMDGRKILHRSSSLSVLVDDVKSAKYRPSTAPVLAKSPPLFFPESASTESIPTEIGIILPPRYSRYTSDFVEVGFLGRGGFGSVYHARNRLDGVDYAVKKVVLKNEMFQKIQDGGMEAFNRILSEVQTMAKLEHGNIVRYYGGWIEGLVGEKFVPAIPVEVDTGVDMLPVGSVLSEDFDNEESPEAAGPAEISDGGILFAYSDSEESRVKTLEDSTTGSKGITQDTKASEESGDATEDEEEASDDSVEWIPRSYPPRIKLATNHSKPRPLSSDHRGNPPKVVFELSAPSDQSESEDVTTSNFFSAGNGALIRSAPRPHRKGHSRTPSAPIVTLHIQMSLHPLVLTSYLSPPHPSPNGEKHCFCLAAALRLFLGLVDGVDYLHQKGIAHRDLKPGNVFLDVICTRNTCACPGGPGTTVVPRIGDFGLVKPIHGTSDGVGGNHNAAVGTEFYRPPAAKASEYGIVARDLFALGVILVELVCRFGTRMERVHTLTNLTQHGRLPVGFDERVAGIVGGCCGFGQNSLHRWDLEKVREVAISIAVAEVGE